MKSYPQYSVTGGIITLLILLLSIVLITSGCRSNNSDSYFSDGDPGDSTRPGGKADTGNTIGEDPMPGDNVPGYENLPNSYTDSTTSIEFVKIKNGCFQMGGSGYLPVHKTCITKSFYMGKTEVTQAQWVKVMNSNPSRFLGDDNRPVERVSWDDVANFITRLNDKMGGEPYRLPTEAEWEYAARAGSTTKYSFGDSATRLGDYAWYSTSKDTTYPVAEKKPNQWGLYDMYGNVWEWVQDWYDANYYGNNPPIDDPEGPLQGGGRVIRGGSYSDTEEVLRSATRLLSAPGGKSKNLGFRLVKKP